MIMENTATTFIETWDSYLILGSYVCFGLALLIILFHEARIMMTSNDKNRYDYVNEHEIRYFWYAIIAFIAGVSLYLSAVITPVRQHFLHRWLCSDCLSYSIRHGENIISAIPGKPIDANSQ
jgi:tellurite resistance protein TehA-like permease